MGQASGKEQRLRMLRQGCVHNIEKFQKKTETEVISKLFWLMQASYQEQLNRLELRTEASCQEQLTETADQILGPTGIYK